MSNITVTFVGQPSLHLAIDDTLIGCRYINLIKMAYDFSRPIYRDTLKYNEDYMKDLAEQAKQVFNWDWDSVGDYTTGIAPVLHKNLEILLKNGFDSIPEQYDNLVHELHYCLHLVQHKKHNKIRNSWLQIEWYNDMGFELPHDFNFADTLNFGDVKLQNPFVGHGPLQIYQEQDHINISQTCKFHNFVKPGINIAERNYPTFTEHQQLIDFFVKHDINFVEKHGVDKILHYTGYPVIGRVINLDDLQQVVEASALKLESIKFE
jgi:hypothetical protein